MNRFDGRWLQFPATVFHLCAALYTSFTMQKTLPFGRAFGVVCHEKRVVCRSGNDFDCWFVKVMVEVMKRVCKELVLCNISD